MFVVFYYYIIVSYHIAFLFLLSFYSISRECMDTMVSIVFFSMRDCLGICGIRKLIFG